MSLQSREASVPDFGIGLEPLVELLQRLRCQEMQPFTPHPTHLYEPRFQQDIQMLGHRLAADGQGLGQLLDGQRTMSTQAIEDLPAGGIGHSTENGLHEIQYMQP